MFSPCPPNSDALFIPSIFGEMDKLVRYHASKLYKIVQNLKFPIYKLKQ